MARYRNPMAQNPWARGFSNLGLALFGDPQGKMQMAQGQQQMDLTTLQMQKLQMDMDLAKEQQSQDADFLSGLGTHPTAPTPPAAPPTTALASAVTGSDAAPVAPPASTVPFAHIPGSAAALPTIDYYKRTAQGESGGDPTKRILDPVTHQPDPTKTASGEYGVIDPTWNNYKGYKSAYLAPQDVQDEFIHNFTANNAALAQQALGRQPVDWEVRATHHFGGDGGVKFLTAADDTPIERVLDAKSIAANQQELAGKTVGQVKDLFRQQYGSGHSWVTQAQQPTQVAQADTGTLSDITPSAGAPQPPQLPQQSSGYKPIMSYDDWKQGLDDGALQAIAAHRRQPGGAQDFAYGLYQTYVKEQTRLNEEANKAPATAGGKYWDRNTHTWADIPNYKDPELGKLQTVVYSKELENNNNIIASNKLLSTKLSAVEEALKADPYTGMGGDLNQSWQRLKRVFGLDSSAGAGDLIQSIQQQIASLQRLPGSGSTSNAEMELYLNSAPSLMRTKEGNEAIITYMKRIADRSVADLQAYNAYVLKHNTNEGFQPDESPIFSEEDKVKLRGGVNAPDPSAPPRQTTPMLYQPTPDETKLLNSDATTLSTDDQKKLNDLLNRMGL